MADRDLFDAFVREVTGEGLDEAEAAAFAEVLADLDRAGREA